VNETKKTIYSCDVCGKEVPEAQEDNVTMAFAGKSNTPGIDVRGAIICEDCSVTKPLSDIVAAVKLSVAPKPEETSLQILTVTLKPSYPKVAKS
jgi:DNA-directed RNA polymerase subunit RPC12/RpoP